MLKFFKTEPIFANYSNTRKLNFSMTIQKLENYSNTRKSFKILKMIEILENHSYSQNDSNSRKSFKTQK